MSKAISNFIERKGGTQVIAAALKIKPVGVRAWRRRGISRKHWPTLIDAFPGTTLEELRGTEKAS